MRRFNHSSHAASSYRPRMASLTAADTSWSIQMLLEEPANESSPDVSGAWPAVNAEAMDLEALLEEDEGEDGLEYALNDDEIELCEDGAQALLPSSRPVDEARLAQTVASGGKRRLASAANDQEQVDELSDDDLVDVTEGAIALSDRDLEVIEPSSGGRIEAEGNGTVLFYCRPGESLPPALVPTSELPRFAIPRGRLPQVPPRLPQFSIVDALPARPVDEPSARLPQFSIPPEPVRKPRVPPVRLPRFPLEEMRPRPPAPRRRPAPLAGMGQRWPLHQHAAVAPSWPLYQTAAASGSWPVQQSGEYPACPHCREQALLAAAWSAAPALMGWGRVGR